MKKKSYREGLCPNISFRKYWKVMRITLGLIIFFGLQVSASTEAQTEKVKLNLKNVSLREVLENIKSQSDLNFIYNNDLVNDQSQVSIEAVNQDVDEVLQKLLDNTGLSYRVVDNNVIIYPAEVSTNAKERTSDNNYAQQVSVVIKGTVTDDRGEALPGVNVYEKSNPTNGVITSIDGSYEISVSSNDAVLSFSFIGYQTQEFNVAGRTSIAVTLVAESIGIQEVIAVGYGIQKKTEVTSSIAKVSADNFNKGFATNALQSIEGKVAGLQIVRTAGTDPNAKPRVRLRGTSSLNASSDPLIIIDGITGGDISSVAPEDIESMDVLRDGSAAAIYGTRGTNGVIIITTKKGVTGDLKVEYSGYVSTEDATALPDVLSADEYRAYGDKKGISYIDGGANTNWSEEIIRKNISHVHNISFSGGTDKLSYRASVNYRNLEGIVMNTGQEYLNGRINLTHKGYNDRLKVQLNMSSTLMNKDYTSYSAFDMAAILNPTMPVKNQDGTYWQPSGYGEFNPVANLNQERKGGKEKNSQMSVRADFDVMKGLSVSAFGAIDVRDNLDHEYDEITSKSSATGGYLGRAKQFTWHQYKKMLETTANYKKVINSHAFTLLGGYSYEDKSFENFWAENKDFVSDAQKYHDLSAGSGLADGKAGMDSYKKTEKLVSFFGRFTYSYESKYLFSATVRREGSSKFGDNNKWATFPAASVGWRLVEEDFLSNASWLNELKLRVGYGVTGNIVDNPYESIPRMGAGSMWILNDQYIKSYGSTTNPNPDLQWETKKETNFGLDFGMLNNRISGSIDIYQRQTNDLLWNLVAQVPPMIHKEVLSNIGEINNKGVEVALNTKIINNETWKVGMDATFSYNENELVSLSDETFQFQAVNYEDLPAPGQLGTIFRFEEGHPIGSFYGYKYKGLTDNGEWIFEDIDGEEGITDADRTFLGNGNPKYNLSFSPYVNVKGFDFSMNFRGAFGFDVLNVNKMYYGNPKWYPGNMLHSAINSPVNVDPQYSDYYLESGNYLKLDNITLGYTVPQKWLLGLGYARLYFSALNVATMTGYSGLDPELELGAKAGVDQRGFYPRTTTYTVGLNVKF
ncbi:SusC/RagA family TonB-linked outer membrane protein [Marinilabiliaceae bacterium JC017]|nr:SusC/RagA family TonB-linked outer membrane protein [Marinilabiliaceae bacterium JC017]